MDESLQPLAGSWSAVEGYGTTYVATAEAIRDAITLLRSIREGESCAESLERLHDDSIEVSDQIARATSRYEVTGLALLDYADDLRLAQLDAEAAIEDADAARVAIGEVQQQIFEVQWGAGSGDADELASRSSAVHALEQLQGWHEADLADAEQAWQAAADRKDEAAQAAASRIDAEIEGSDLNDSFWDDLWGGLGDVFEWIGDAIVAFVKTVLSIVIAIALAALVVLVGLLVVALASALPFGLGLVGLLVGGAIVAGGLTWLLNGGAWAFAKTLAAGDLTSPQTWIDATIGGAIAWLRGTFPWLAAWIVSFDAGDPELKHTGFETREQMRDMTPGDILAALQQGNVDADAQELGAGGDGLDSTNSSQVVVTAVEQPDGSTVYRVNIPSTQQWFPGTDGINDISSDATAKLTDQQTQLERAVIDAMQQAQVPEGASVVLSGWSLGGITAGNLAADADFTSAYDVDAVVVAGASLDDQDIPTSIPVLDLSHSEDLVQRTEDPSAASHRDDPNRTRITVDMPPSAEWPGHKGDQYQLSMQQQGDQQGSEAAAFVERNDLDRYFGGAETVHAYTYQRGE